MIREIVNTDTEVLKSLYNEFISEMNSIEDDGEDAPIGDWIENALNEDSSVIFVYENSNEITGFTRLQLRKWEENKYLKISDLYVSKAHRKNGIAHSLIQKSMDYGHENGCSYILLNVFKRNLNAYKLYKSMGFNDICEIRHSRIRMKCEL